MIRLGNGSILPWTEAAPLLLGGLVFGDRRVGFATWLAAVVLGGCQRGLAVASGDVQ